MHSLSQERPPPVASQRAIVLALGRLLLVPVVLLVLALAATGLRSVTFEYFHGGAEAVRSLGSLVFQ